MSKTVSVASIQRTPTLEGQTVRVQGWVRTRRDSKAGLSFVNLSDGSCQHAAVGGSEHARELRV